MSRRFRRTTTTKSKGGAYGKGVGLGISVLLALIVISLAVWLLRRSATDESTPATAEPGEGVEAGVEEAVVGEASTPREAGEQKDRAQATPAAERKADELGVELSQIEGTGSGGLVTVKDVTSLSEDSSAAGQAAGQAQEAVGQATDQAGQAVQGAQEATGQVTDQATGALGGVTDQVGQVAQGVQDTAGQATQQAQETAGQATQQAQDAAGAAGQVTGQAAGEDEEPKGATNAARRKAEELGVDLSQVQGSGAGGLITLRDVTGS